MKMEYLDWSSFWYYRLFKIHVSSNIVKRPFSTLPNAFSYCNKKERLSESPKVLNFEIAIF